MKKIALLIIVVLLTLQAKGQTKNFIDRPYLETIAKIDSLVTPDKIHLTIILNEQDSRNKKSTEALEQAMLKVFKSLKIDIEKNLSVLDYSSDFKKYFLSSQKILKSKMYALVLKDAQTVGKVMSSLELEGISNVSISKTEYSESNKLLLHLKSKAIAKAKQNALKMVEPLNQKIGKAIYISDLTNETLNNQLHGKVAGIQIRGYSSLYGSKQEDIIVEFKKIKFTSQVSVKFIIE